MQFISKKWYVFYNWVLIAISGLFVVFYVITKAVPSLEKYAISLDLTAVGSAFGLAIVIYGLIVFRIVSKKTNFWLAAIISSSLFYMFLIAQISNINSRYVYVYIALWLCVTIYTGAFGLLIVMGGIFLAIVVAVLQANPNFAGLPTEYIVLVAGAFVVGFGSYYGFWVSKIKKNQTDDKIFHIDGLSKDTKKQDEILIESIGDGVVVTDRTGRVSLINPAASLMSEWKQADAVGVDVSLVIKLTAENGQAISMEKNPFHSVLTSNLKVETSALLTGHNGKQMIVSLVVSPVVIDNVSVGLVAVIRDISAQRAAEQQRADFISTASHEMRTPVAAIEGYLSLAMNERVSSIDDRARDFLDKAHTSTQQLGKLFQDLLTSSKAEDGRLTNHPQVVEMNEFMKNLTESFQLAAEKKHLIVDFVNMNESGLIATDSGKPEDIQFYVHVDPERISELIINLFDNAVKYTQAGKITIGLGGDETKVHVYIQDTGPGIPAEDVPHLFQKFYRVDNSSVRTIGGTGLGLFICKKIVDLYDGQIWVESQLGKGSTFRINLPRLKAQQAETLKRTETVENQVAMPSSNLT